MTFEEIKKILSRKTVGIASFAGLGLNCAIALARVGVGKLIIADFDVIVESNLSRQYFFYDQIGQKKCFALKEMILNTVLHYLPQKPLIMGVGLAGWGNFSLIKEYQFDNVYIMGDMTIEVSDEVPPIAPRVGIVANMQANKALEILLKV